MKLEGKQSYKEKRLKRNREMQAINMEYVTLETSTNLVETKPGRKSKKNPKPQ